MSRSPAVARVATADVGVPVLVTLATVEIVLALLARPGELGSPLGGLLVPWSLLSCLAPLALAAIWWGPLAAIERTCARGALAPTLIRLGTAGAVVAAATLAVAVAAPVAGDGLAAWRNAALVSGVTVACAAWLPATVAWFPRNSVVTTAPALGDGDRLRAGVRGGRRPQLGGTVRLDGDRPAAG